MGKIEFKFQIQNLPVKITPLFSTLSFLGFKLMFPFAEDGWEVPVSYEESFFLIGERAGLLSTLGAIHIPFTIAFLDQEWRILKIEDMGSSQPDRYTILAEMPVTLRKRSKDA